LEAIERRSRARVEDAVAKPEPPGCCIDKKKVGGKIFSNLQSNSGAVFSNSSTTFRDISLAQSWQNKKLNSASTFQTCSGT
jgi:hypothetical protein